MARQVDLSGVLVPSLAGIRAFWAQGATPSFISLFHRFFMELKRFFSPLSLFSVRFSPRFQLSPTTSHSTPKRLIRRKDVHEGLVVGHVDASRLDVRQVLLTSVESGGGWKRWESSGRLSLGQKGWLVRTPQWFWSGLCTSNMPLKTSTQHLSLRCCCCFKRQGLASSVVPAFGTRPQVFEKNTSNNPKPPNHSSPILHLELQEAYRKKK